MFLKSVAICQVVVVLGREITVYPIDSFEESDFNFNSFRVGKSLKAKFEQNGFQGKIVSLPTVVNSHTPGFLGKGAFGCVCKRAYDGEDHAVKVMDIWNSDDLRSVFNEFAWFLMSLSPM